MTDVNWKRQQLDLVKNGRSGARGEQEPTIAEQINGAVDKAIQSLSSDQKAILQESADLVLKSFEARFMKNDVNADLSYHC